MKEIKKVLQDFIEKVKSLQEKDKKDRRFLGLTSSYVPEEIIVAAGMVPFRITGSTYPLSLSKTYFSGNISSFAQSCLEGALRKEYDFLEGVVIGGETDAIKRLYDAWLHFVTKNDHVYLFDIPKLITGDALLHYRESIISLKQRIEKDFDLSIDDKKLFEAIALCNDTRSMLNKLNSLRKSGIAIIDSIQILEICQLGISGDKNTFNTELKALLGQLEDKIDYKNVTGATQPRLLMTGSFQGGRELLSIIQKSGGNLVCEDLDNRIGYFRTEVPSNNDPLLAIAIGYMEKPPSASVVDFQKRADYLLSLIKEFNIKGVIYHVLKFDDPYLFEFPDIKESFSKNKIPVVRIETEVGRMAEGQIKTRIEAFIDTLSLSYV